MICSLTDKLPAGIKSAVYELFNTDKKMSNIQGGHTSKCNLNQKIDQIAGIKLGITD
jgi:hypothetical protein